MALGSDKTRLSIVVAGSALVLLGAAVMAGWVMGIPRFVQVAPTWVPTVFNAGLGLLLFGVGLLAALRRLRTTSFIAGALLATVGILTLAEYFFSTNFGIDEVFVRDALSPVESIPGRMSANAAALQLLVGVTLLFATLRDSRDAAAIVAWASGWLLLVAGAWVVFPLPELDWTGWFGFKQMSYPEGVGCLVGGIGLLALSHRWGDDPVALRSDRLAALIFLLLAAVGVNMWQALTSVDLMRVQTATQLAARSIEAQLRNERRDLYAAFQRLNARLQRAEGRVTLDDWTADAEDYVDQIPSIRSLQLLDAEGQILRLVTRRPELTIPDDLMYTFDEQRARMFERALATMQLVVSPPMEMRLGGKGFMLLMPFETVGGPMVLVVGMAYAEVFEAILGDVAPGYALDVHIGGEAIFERTGGTVPSDEIPLARLSLSAPEAPWEIRVWPLRERGFAPQGALPLAVLLLALAGSLMVAVAFRYAMLARSGLAAAVHANERLRSERSISDTIWQHSNDVLCTTDRDGVFVRVSAAAQELWGYKPEELEGRSALELVIADDLERTERVRDGVPAGTAVHGFINRMRHRNGSIVYVSWSAQWSEVLGLNVALARNITALMEHERELAAGEERLRVAVEQTGRLVFDRAADATHSHWVGDPVALLGMTREELAALSDDAYWQRTHPEDRKAAGEAFERALAEGGSFRIRYRWQCPNGRWIWMEDAGAVIDGRLVAVKTDITEQREAEASLEERVALRTRELVHANTELEAFSYSVSHDLRTPLRAISGFSELLREQYSDQLDETAIHYLQRIETGAGRMSLLIDDLLTLGQVSRRELALQTVNLSAMAKEVVDRLRESEPGRRVDLRVAPDLTARCDPRLAEIVLENLLGNAWKFTRDSDPAVIEVDRIDGAFRVRDNGVGFDMDHAGQLFGVFQRLHGINEFPGTGIGLATVKRIVERHGGSTWAKGEIGKGASFFFTFSG
ncbi:MAG: PAS domain-containing protein [Xanthomonadaceae bacterium]|nr:PAS domain-containing protein [Xanthomonadaceae bacterium]